jgi:integrase
MTELEPLAQGDLVPAAPQRRDQNPYWVYLHGLDGGTSFNTMKGCLDHIAKMLAPELDRDPGEHIPWGDLRFQHTAMLRSRLLNTATVNADGTEQPWSPSTINKHLSALRGVLRSAWMLGQMTAEDYHRARDVKSVKGGKRRTAGRNIAEEEVAALLTACLNDPSPAGIRDAAMISVFQSTGMRREEVARARRTDYDPGERGLTIVGKGGVSREVFLHPVAAVYLGQWLSITEEIRGALFCPVDRWGNVLARHMSKEAVANALVKRRKQAAVARLSPHDFRRTFAGNLLDNGVDLARVQQLMGHASPVTTADYDRRPGRERKAAIDTLTLPRPEDLQRTETTQ